MEIPILWSLQKAYMPLVVTHGKVEALCFLIDTGATHNVLFSHVYEGLKEELGDEFTEVFKKTIEEKQHIMGIEGSRTETPIVEATFNIEGIDYTSTFCIFDDSNTNAMEQVQEETGIQIHGILGIQFLIENKWVLDFKNFKIRTEETDKTT